MTTMAFMDASNLFYGGEKDLGWKIDYQRLSDYLHEKYDINKVFYFGGIEIHGFPYDYQTEMTVPLDRLERYLGDTVMDRAGVLSDAELLLVDRHLKRVRFYQKLVQFGYVLCIKPVKFYTHRDGGVRGKANCDVDMTLCLVTESVGFDRAIILSGDGDFLPVLKYVRSIGKEVLVLARGSRTAREIRQFARGSFRDFEYLRERLRVRPIERAAPV